ncbi:hypothetical protein BDZ45DRAFT_729829 [Acephala macrosclerotiorum]|nr:hypothetical protein BDZ45DRAFT_729829 [Acephala macrosclerotiorum]
MKAINFLYVFYLAKVAIQSYVSFAWLENRLIATITYAASVAVLSVVPLFHVIIHMTKKAPLSDLAVIIYLCLSYILAFLWHEPTRAAKQRANGILSFALVTTNDLLILILFCLHNLVLLLRHKQNKDPEVAEVRLPPAELSRVAEQHFRHEPAPTEPSERQDATRSHSLGSGCSFRTNFPHPGTPRVASSVDNYGVVAEASMMNVQRIPRTESEDQTFPTPKVASTTSHGMSHVIRHRDVVAPQPVRQILLSDGHPLFKARRGGVSLDSPLLVHSPAESHTSKRAVTLAGGEVAALQPVQIAFDGVHPLYTARSGSIVWSGSDPQLSIHSPAESQASERTVTLGREAAVGNMF